MAGETCSSGLRGPGGTPRLELLWVAGSHGKRTGFGIVGRAVPEQKEHSKEAEAVQAWGMGEGRPP